MSELSKMIAEKRWQEFTVRDVIKSGRANLKTADMAQRQIELLVLQGAIEPITPVISNSGGRPKKAYRVLRYDNQQVGHLANDIDINAETAALSADVINALEPLIANMIFQRISAMFGGENAS